MQVQQLTIINKFVSILAGSQIATLYTNDNIDEKENKKSSEELTSEDLKFNS